MQSFMLTEVRDCDLLIVVTSGLEVGFVSACSWLALVTGVEGYVLAGVEIGVLSCIFLYFCGC